MNIIDSFSPERLTSAVNDMLARRKTEDIIGIEVVAREATALGVVDTKTGSHDNLNVSPEVKNFEMAELEANFSAADAPDTSLDMTNEERQAQVDQLEAEFAASDSAVDPRPADKTSVVGTVQDSALSDELKAQRERHDAALRAVAEAHKPKIDGSHETRMAA